jgi:hypothetical protein
VIKEIVNDLLGGNTPQMPLTLLQVAARAGAIYLIGLALVRMARINQCSARAKTFGIQY